jgi:antitoxin CcdA
MRISNVEMKVMTRLFDPNAPKKATNVSINSDLLQQARNIKLNLSAALEQALTDHLREKRRAQWRKDNAAAIQAYNEHVDKHGTFSDEVRKF